VATAIVRPKPRLELAHITEPLGGLSACFLGRDATRLELGCAHLEVKANFVVDVGVDVRSPEAEVATPAWWE
jgi:hypothetical protein